MAHTLPASGYAPTRSPVALIGAVGIPAAFGALLVAGLAVTAIIEERETRPDTVFIEDPDVVIPPPPPEPKPVNDPIQDPITQVATPQTETIVIPETPVDFGQSEPFEVTSFPNLPLDPVTTPSGLGTVPNPVPTFDPVSASPRNDPGRWIMERDYRSIWIRQDMAGVARFTLDVDASGRVTDCSITRSTGHAPLDNATCELITKRARFNPARDNQGDPTSSTYSSSVRWELP